STATDTVNTGGSNAAVITTTYIVAVANGQLDLSLASAGAAVIDGLSFVKDTSAFTVTGTTPANGSSVSGGLNSITVTFNHPANMTTGSSGALNAANYILTGPGSSGVGITGVTQVGSQAVIVAFSPQTAVGVYTLNIGSGIQDVGGNVLGPGMSTTVTKTAVTSGKYDFGTSMSPVGPGYTQATDANGYSVAQGYGWLPGAANLGSFDTGIVSNSVPDPSVTRDFDYTTNGTFAADVPNGLYDVTLTLGDARGFAYSNVVYFGNSSTPTDTINTGGSNPAIITTTYVVGVTNGQLDFGLRGLTGGFAVVDGVSFQPDFSAFAVTSTAPSNTATVTGGVAQISVTYNHPVSATALATSNYTLFGPNGAVTIAGITQLNSQTIAVSFATQTTFGSYTLTVLPNVQDAVGNALGSSNSIIFNIVPVTSAQFDFDTPSSPVASGWTQITPTSTFNLVSGYGWISGTIGGFDTGIGTFTTPDSSVTRDFDYTTSGTFGVNVANGTYSVTLTLGDARSNPYQMNIYFQNSSTPIATVSTGGSNPSIVNDTYTVTVTNGQLDVGLTGMGGGTSAVIEGLTLAKIA
ncbi:MAG TPA: Ig-like domain-containing protein, partial [Tepidisphaeraceae bacterium]|nr:Ig-like domain-containing protein [Tepidisphaeraceae bacterium]